MYSIRKGVFETNSSSTHSIVIERGKLNFEEALDRCFGEEGNVILFEGGEFGWEYGVADNTQYLWTAILQFVEEDNEDALEEWKKYISHALGVYGYQAEFLLPTENDFWYIDHGYELEDFINWIAQSPDNLIRYLVTGEVYTGNDNDGDMDSLCCVAYEAHWGERLDGTWGEIPNPNRDEKKYIYFYKGN